MNHTTVIVHGMTDSDED